MILTGIEPVAVRVRVYIIRETIIATLFNMAFSFGFAYAFFGNVPQVPQLELILDAGPQSFFVTFFGVLIPSLIARNKLRAGKLEGLPHRETRLPSNPYLRAIAMAVIAAVGGVALHFIALKGLQIEQLARETVLIYKPVFGALLTWVVTPIGLRIILSQRLDKQ